MAEIRSDLPSVNYAEVAKDRNQADQQLENLLRDIKKDRTQLQQLRNLEINKLSPAQQRNLAHMLAQQLRGQIPPSLAKALNNGTADPALLGQLAQRLANANSNDPSSRFGLAQTADLARALASDGKIPQQALRWAQFVQKATHVPGSGIQGRTGATPKGEGTLLAEMIASKLARGEGTGLRNPKLVDRMVTDLSPTQRAMLMRATFGPKLATQLAQMGITDPLSFVKAGALPTDRALLSSNLNIPRGRLLALLMRAELLKIGPGRNGELGMRPDFLGPLKAAGVAMLGTLAAIRGLSREELAHIYRRLREEAGGFRTAIRGGRVPVKRDLIHWARTAARRRSDILLADSEEYEGEMGRPDAQELVQTWYLENLLWQELAARRREEQYRIMRDQHERQQREQDEQEDQQDDQEWFEEDLVPDLEYDEQRDDDLMCFWITDYNTDPLGPGGMRRMYVCIDPATGAIIPQQIEREYLPTM